MTQEQKAQAYDEVLERAKKQRADYQKELDKTDRNSQLAGLLRAGISAIDMAFPELAESEDERIRKNLVEYHKQQFEKNRDQEIGLFHKDAIAYLEKMKEANKAIEAVDRIDKYIDENVANAHDMKDSNPDKKYYRGWDDALGEMARILQDVYSGKKQKEQSITTNDLDEEIERFFDECIEPHDAKIYGVNERVITVDCYELTARHFAQWGEKQKEQETTNELEDAFKYYTDRGITISCGDFKAEPKKEQNGKDEECTDFTIYHPFKNGKGEYECIPYSFYGSLTSFSEDKDLIDFLRTCFYTKEECNEWIKQQKEQEPIGTDFRAAVKNLMNLHKIKNEFTEEDYDFHAKELLELVEQKEQKPVVTHGETYHVDTLGTQQVIAGKMPQKPIECIEFDNEFEKQVSHLLASVLNGEWEYDEGFVKHAAQSLLGYAKNELKQELPLMGGDTDAYFDDLRITTKPLTSREWFDEGIKYAQRLQKEQKTNYCLYGGYPNVGRCRWCSAACSARLADVHTDEEKEYIRTIKSIISDFIRDKKPEYVGYYQRIYDWLDGRHVPFSCGYENGKSTEWAELQSEFKNINEAFEDGKKEVIDHPDKYGLTKQKTPDPVFSKQEYESYPIISEDTTSAKPADLDGKALLYTADKSYQIGFRDGVASVKPAEWGEDDEQKIGTLSSIIYDYAFLKDALDENNDLTGEYAELEDWLEELPERFNLPPKQAWSEEDEKDVAHIIRVLDDCYAYGKHDLSKTDHENLVGTLKSLRPSWKPSEEQMEELNKVRTLNPGLDALYQQLKNM